MRPIDGDALEKILDEWRADLMKDSDKGQADEMAHNAGLIDGISGSLSEMLLLPRLTVESMIHAAWELGECEEANLESGEHTIATARCSHCKRWCEQIRDWTGRVEYEYCPHCGAKMMIDRRWFCEID